MKKKTMQTLFVLLFICGVIVGYLLPGNIKSLAKAPLQAGIFDVPKKLGQLDIEGPYFKYTLLATAETGSVELLRIDDKVPMHMNTKENHFVYIFKGRGKAAVGTETYEVWPGQIIVVPAGVPYSFERIGDTPVEIILFSTPPFAEDNTIYLEKK